jgi:hypothetical protein
MLGFGWRKEARVVWRHCIGPLSDAPNICEVFDGAGCEGRGEDPIRHGPLELIFGRFFVNIKDIHVNLLLRALFSLQTLLVQAGDIPIQDPDVLLQNDDCLLGYI